MLRTGCCRVCQLGHHLQGIDRELPVEREQQLSHSDGHVQLRLFATLPRAPRSRRHYAVDHLFDERPPNVDSELVVTHDDEMPGLRGSVYGSASPGRARRHARSSPASVWSCSCGAALWGSTSGSPSTAAGKPRPWPIRRRSTLPAISISPTTKRITLRLRTTWTESWPTLPRTTHRTRD